MITVQHPTAGTIQFPDGTSQEEMAAAMAQLDAPQAPVQQTQPSPSDYVNQARRSIAQPIDMSLGDLSQIKSMGLVGGGAALGQSAGMRMGVAAPVAAPVLGGIGAGTGSIIDQLTDSQPGISWGRVGGDFVAGMIPAKPGATGARAVAREAAVQGIGNLAAAQTQQAIDPQGGSRVLSMPEGIGAFASGLAASEIGRGFAGKTVGPKVNRGIETERYNAINEMRRVVDGLNLKDEAGKPIRFLVDPGSLRHDGGLAHSFAQPAVMAREVSAANGSAIHAVARRALGLSVEAAPITRESLERRIKQEYWQPYRKLQEIGDQAQKQLDTLNKQALTDGSGHGGAYQADNPEYRRMAGPLKQQAAAKDAIERLPILKREIHDTIEQVSDRVPGARQRLEALKAEERNIDRSLFNAAKSSGQPGLVQELAENRRKAARAFAVMGAVDNNGVMDARKLARQLDNGVPLDGDLKRIAKAAQAIKYDVVPVTDIRSVNSSGLEATAGAATSIRDLQKGEFWDAAKNAVTFGQLPKARAAVRGYYYSPDFQNKILAQRTEGEARFMAALTRQMVMQQGRQPMPTPPGGQ